MNRLKEIAVKAVTCCLLLTLIPVTGCSAIKERMDNKKAQRELEEKYKFSTDKDFLNFYRKEITNALRTQDDDALRDLFCETVVENTDDFDEGIEYVFAMEDWSEIGTLRSNSSSYKEYKSEYHFLYVNAWQDVSAGDKEYRIYFSGYANYYAEVKGSSYFSVEDTGLTNLQIYELDDNNDPIETQYGAISGIYHPGRKACEEIVNTVLNTYSSTNDDGSYIDTMTDEALESIMTPSLLKSADEDELESFIQFIRYGSLSKKNKIYFFLEEKNGGYVLTNVVHFELEDRCLTILVKDGLIDGAAFSEDEDPVTPKSGEIEGFFGVID